MLHSSGGGGNEKLTWVSDKQEEIFRDGERKEKADIYVHKGRHVGRILTYMPLILGWDAIWIPKRKGRPIMSVPEKYSCAVLWKKEPDLFCVG